MRNILITILNVIKYWYNTASPGRMWAREHHYTHNTPRDTISQTITNSLNDMTRKSHSHQNEILSHINNHKQSQTSHHNEILHHINNHKQSQTTWPENHSRHNKNEILHHINNHKWHDQEITQSPEWDIKSLKQSQTVSNDMTSNYTVARMRYYAT